MEKNNHRGDSLTKRIARFEFYLRARAWIGEEKFKTLRFLYLASFEGGDASVLGAMGVPASNQLAVDFDAKALRRFSEKYPKVPTYCGAVESLPPAEMFDLIFLDFCTNVSDRMIAACVKASAHLRVSHNPHRGQHCADHGRSMEDSGSIFAFAFQRGRERGWKGKFEQAARSDSEISAVYHKALQLPLYKEPSRRLNDGRTSVVYDAVSRSFERRKLGLFPLCKIAYRSVNPEELASGKPGTPMMISGFWAGKPSRQRLDFSEWLQMTIGLNLLLQDEWIRLLIACRSEGMTYEHETRLGPVLIEKVVSLAAVGGGPSADLTGFESKACFHRAILTCVDHGLDPARALNVSRGVVAAVQAHATRGTYVGRNDSEMDVITAVVREAAELRGMHAGVSRPPPG